MLLLTPDTDYFPINYYHYQSTIGGVVAQLVERQASNRKVARPWSCSRCGSALLCPWERYLMLFPILGPSSLPVMVAKPDERHANTTASVLEWYDRHRAYNIWFKWRRTTTIIILLLQDVNEFYLFFWSPAVSLQAEVSWLLQPSNHNLSPVPHFIFFILVYRLWTIKL